MVLQARWDVVGIFPAAPRPEGSGFLFCSPSAVCVGSPGCGPPSSRLSLEGALGV